MGQQAAGLGASALTGALDLSKQGLKSTTVGVSVLTGGRVDGTHLIDAEPLTSNSWANQGVAVVVVGAAVTSLWCVRYKLWNGILRLTGRGSRKREEPLDLEKLEKLSHDLKDTIEDVREDLRSTPWTIYRIFTWLVWIVIGLWIALPGMVHLVPQLSFLQPVVDY